MIRAMISGPLKPSYSMMMGMRGLSSSSGVSSHSLFLALTAGPQLASQVLNQAHQVLPWWAAIPCVTLVARALLLPLSLQARKAMGHVPIFKESLSRSAAIRDEAVKAHGLDRTHLPSLIRLARAIHAHEASRAGLPSFNWAIVNGAAQSLVFISFTSALRHMSTNLWPGLASEGLMGLNDLTQPPLTFSPTLSAPHGTMGALIPLGMVLAYTRAVDHSSASNVSGVNNVLKASSLPFYLITLVQPHSVLLSWVSTLSSTILLQSLIHQPLGSIERDQGENENVGDKTVLSPELVDKLATNKNFGPEFIACIRGATRI